MTLIKLGAAVLNQTPLAWDENKHNILLAIQQAREEHVSILCLPELCLTGYGCEDAFLSAGVCQTALELLTEIVPQTEQMVVALGLPCRHEGNLYNAACLVADGQILGLAAKQNLAGDGLHYEPRWFKPWQRDQQASTSINGNDYPLGDLIFDLGAVRVAFEICEDAWVQDRPGVRLAARGAQLILNPSASHFAFGKQQQRRNFVLDASRDLGVSYIYTNLLGNEAGRSIYDGGAMIASQGELVAAGPRLTFHDLQLTTAVVDIEPDNVEPAAADGAGQVTAPFTFPACQPQPARAELAAWEAGPHLKEEEFARAVSLGLFDYLRKSRSHGFVVSLSGGADSATVATLCGLLVEFGSSQLGAEAFASKLSYLENQPAEADTSQWVHQLLACVYQSTRNSSQTTRNAASELAAALGAEFFEFDVDSIVNDYRQIVATALGRELTWHEDDIALQNIQARSRAPGVWLLANIGRALLLATSNRSEAAVGYTTMDGDTCGGIAPIAGIDKAFLLHWLRWMETVGPAGAQPLPALAAITSQQPTAELRPPEEGQTDESDLMPYKVLDDIERLAVRDKLMPLEIYRTLAAGSSDYSASQLGQWTRRFFQLWSQNQWKRERFAPSFHLDDENLDPKTWCRFPILSGGFQRELAELEKVLAGEA